MPLTEEQKERLGITKPQLIRECIANIDFTKSQIKLYEAQAKKHPNLTDEFAGVIQSSKSLLTIYQKELKELCRPKNPSTT